MFSFKGRLPLAAHRSSFARKGFVRRQFHETFGDFAAEPSHAEAVQGGDHANDYLSTTHASTLHNAEQEMHCPITHRLAIRSATLVRPASLVRPVPFVRSVSFLRPALTRPTSAPGPPTPTMFLVRRGCHDLFSAEPHSPEPSSTEAGGGPGEGKPGVDGAGQGAEKTDDDLKTRVMVLERLHEHVTTKGLARVEGEIKSTKNEGRGFFSFLVSVIMLGVGLKIWSYDVAMQEKYDNSLLRVQEKYDNSLLRVQDRIGADMEKMEKRLEKGQELIQEKLDKLLVRRWF